jgi:hypothetical protein
MKNIRLSIEHDCDVEHPLAEGLWKVHSFCSSHIDYALHGKFCPISEELSQKLKDGRAFRLSYYEHGLCKWGLIGETPNCPWDNVNDAGLLVFYGNKEEEEYLPESYEDREAIARAIMAEYTSYCNGECYFYTIEEEILCDKCGNVEDTVLIDSCGGFIGSEYMIEVLKDEHGELLTNNNVKFVGQFSYLVEDKF